MLLTTEKLSKAYKSRKKGEPVFWAAKEVCVEIVRKHYNADRKSLQAVFLTEKTG